MYLAVLGRQSEISIAELEAQFLDVKKISEELAEFRTAGAEPDIARLGGSLKIAVKLEKTPLEYLTRLEEGKLTIGVSDYSKKASAKNSQMLAMKLKRVLVKQGRSVRIVTGDEAVLSTATSLHNGLSGKNSRKMELIKYNDKWYKVIGVQDIDAYAKRDQGRPARDAKVGMLPPKLAQILINLCGELPEGATVLDAFCGTGVVLQEAILMGYSAYGTDIEERMVEYTKRNLEWLGRGFYTVTVGDATTFQWKRKIDAVACEGYLGKPMSKIPAEMELKEQKQICGGIILGFLKNLCKQVGPGVPVVMAIPAWLRTSGKYERMEVIDEIEDMGYNVNNKSREGLLYHRDGQIVARDIIILRKK
ncbi:MAG: methyltransferase domain-containing protein [Candidatus Saccharibacteria bacterium]|nr:methyltransferase domain-containing protein [Candidatus Saccharibacteria bacterium]